MDIIAVTADNLEKEHICCAISSNKDPQVLAKKEWLRDRFAEGLVFKKGAVRGKCFIEYIPAEQAWAPILAPGYMYINCLWVSGQFKGQGYSNLLLEQCLADAQAGGKKGLCILSAKKKMPFLADPSFLSYKGFSPADVAEPFYQLYYLPFATDGDKPRFADSVKSPAVDPQGFVLYYSHQCPYPAKYVPLIQAVAEEMGLDFQAIRFMTGEEARRAPAPFTAYSLFYQGKFITNEIQSEKKFAALAAELSV